MNNYVILFSTKRLTAMLATTSIKELFTNQPIDPVWAFQEYKPSQTAKWTNGYHRYPAKFIPQLVEKLLDEYLTINEQAIINDPFIGSGTTLVSGLVKGYKVTGTDVNDFAYLLSKVKTTPIEPGYLASRIQVFYEQTLNLDNIEPYIPERHLERIDYWFEKENKVILGKMLTLINQETDKNVRNFLLVAFSNILKNCSIWLQKSNKPTRDLKKKRQIPQEILKRQLRKMLKGNKSFWQILPAKVKENPNQFIEIACQDARNQPVVNNSIDIIITSSPYVTSYEYADLHQLSTLWLDFTDDLKVYRKKFIGTIHKSYENEIVKSKIALEIIEKMSIKSKKKAKEIEAFFLDMEEVIQESYRILKKGSRACYVIGNTKLKGVDIWNAEAFVEIMLQVGFSLDRIIKREIPSKSLPQTRDKETGRFAKASLATSKVYPTEFIIIGQK